VSSSGASTVTLLGAAGFIGSYVIAELVRRRLSVIAVSDTLPPSNPGHGVEWVQLDLDERMPELQGSTTCIHLAEPSMLTDPVAAERNLARVRRVFSTPFERIVYVSSAVVYGAGSSVPRRETEDVSPQGLYARAKADVERVVATDPRCAIARVANVYGHGMSPHNVLSEILHQISAPGEMVLRDLEPVRDYIHVSDVARALVELARSSVRGIFNIGTMRGASVQELARIACAAARTPARAVVASDPRHSSSVLVLDVQRMRSELGWTPSVTLEEGVAELVREQLT
jgi:nucleoside-diphosphate-sugar epimerase